MPTQTPSSIRLYGTRFCVECERAAELLTRHGLQFELIDASDPDHCCQLHELTGRRILPQAFIDEHAFYGYEELASFIRKLLDEQSR